jgi:hypothetical protein
MLMESNKTWTEISSDFAIQIANNLSSKYDIVFMGLIKVLIK